MTTNKKRVLVFPCGSEVGLEINRALSNDIHFEVFGASSLSDHGKFVYKNYIEGIPFVNDDGFVDEINKVCKEFKIDFIIPAHDDVVLKLARHAGDLIAKVITSPLETCDIVRSKKKTYDRLKHVILCPKTYSIDEEINFPVFIKPDIGQGSKGAKQCVDRSELEMHYFSNPDIVISELLIGKEYTIDCFTNKNGELLFVGGRERSRISNGISVNSYPVKKHEFQTMAEKINSELKFRGMWFFQVKENSKGELILLEIAPRIAGTMGLYRGLGVNFVLLALYDAMGLSVSIVCNDFDVEIDRALASAYRHNIQYTTVYIDFDDTIFCNGTVNADIMKFLYQSKNEGKKLILITKHEKNIRNTLVECRISLNLFDEIIQIESDQSKSDFITNLNSIFIDDSFVERYNISKNLGIPVFGTDAIEVLLNSKM